MIRFLLYCLLLFFISCASKKPVVDPHSANYTQQIGIKDKKQKKKYQYSVYDKRTGSYRAVYLDKTGKYGVADSSGALVIPARYDNMYTSEMGLFKCQLDGKWGFIDVYENPVIPFGKYESFGSFSEGFVPAFKNNKWGFLNVYGQVVVPFKYFYVTEFHEGRAFVQEDQHGSSAIIDREGNHLSDFVFSCINMCYFRNNAAIVYFKNKAVDIIDTNGLPLLGFRYTNLRFSDLKDDLIWAQEFPNEVIGTTPGGQPMYKQGKWGLVDRSNSIILPFVFEDVMALRGGRSKVKKNGKWGIIKPNGEYLAECNYNTPDDIRLSDAFFAQAGEQLSDGSYQLALTGKDGSRAVFLYNPENYTRLYGIVDKHNKIVVPFIYEYTSAFENGYALVKKNNAYGYADSTGKLLSECRYEYAEPFQEGYAIVYSNGSFRLIDTKEQEVFSYPEIKRAAPYRYIIKVGNDAGAVNEKGNIVIPAVYHHIYISGPQQNKFTVQKNYKKTGEDKHAIIYTVEIALFDLDGKQLTPWIKETYSDPLERPLHIDGIRPK